MPLWGPVKRLLFRFLFAYFVLYIFPFPLNVIPGAEAAIGPYFELWNAIVMRAGALVFDASITVLPNGSGDTTYNYVQVFCYLILAALAAAVWTLLDRKRPHYARLTSGSGSMSAIHWPWRSPSATTPPGRAP